MRRSCHCDSSSSISASAAYDQAFASISLSTLADCSLCPSEGNRRHAVAITARSSTGVAEDASRSRSPSVQAFRSIEMGNMAASRTGRRRPLAVVPRKMIKVSFKNEIVQGVELYEIHKNLKLPGSFDGSQAAGVFLY